MPASASRSGRRPLSGSARRTHFRSVRPCSRFSRRWIGSSPIASRAPPRARRPTGLPSFLISGEYFFVLIMAPFSHGLGLPTNPGRFNDPFPVGGCEIRRGRPHSAGVRSRTPTERRTGNDVRARFQAGEDPVDILPTTYWVTRQGDFSYSSSRYYFAANESVLGFPEARHDRVGVRIGIVGRGVSPPMLSTRKGLKLWPAMA